MNVFRNFSIGSRLLITFLSVVFLPVCVFIYVCAAKIPVNTLTAVFIGAISVIIAVVTAFLVSSSIGTPIRKIQYALQAFSVRKSAASIQDSGTDELSQIAAELNELFNTWNKEIVSLGKKQLVQDKAAEQTEIRLADSEKQLELSRSMLTLAQTLNTTFDFQSNLKAILDEAVSTLCIQWGSILLIDREKHEMRVACVRGVEKSLVDDLIDTDYPSIRLKPHEGLAGQVIKEGVPLIANKGYKDPRFKQFSEFKSRDEKVASLLCAPIIDKDENVLGVINLINRITPPVFRNEDLPFVHDLCTLASIVIERNRVYKRLFQDSATGLTSYNIFKEYLNEEIARAIRFAQPLTLVVAEIDSFKKIAEKSNVDFTLEIASECGQIIKNMLRDTDNASSVQERFLMLLSNTDVSGGVFFMGRVKEAFESHVFEFGERKFNITVSAGIACYPETTKDSKGLLISAVKALGAAQEAGGGKTHIFGSPIDPQ